MHSTGFAVTYWVRAVSTSVGYTSPLKVLYKPPVDHKKYTVKDRTLRYN